MKRKRTPNAKCLSVDRISTLPSTIIENILCLVPIKDAVRTSILSRNWRYNWVKIPKLVFNKKDMFDNLFDKNQQERLEIWMFDDVEPYAERKKMNARFRVFYAIYQVLLQHEGPIHEFTLSMDADKACIEIDQIIAYLSRKNTVKKFTLDLTNFDSYHLPQSFYSLHQLTDVYLCRCSFDYRHTFKEFPILTSLCLNYVCLDVEILVRLLSNSPSLKSFSLVTEENNIEEKYKGDGSFYDMFKYLPVIEHLTLCMWVFRDREDEVPQELPSALVHLKYLCLQNVFLYDKRELSLLAHLIRISPNLEKIKLQIFPLSERDPIRVQVYSDIWLQHLNELEIEDYVDFRLELEFVKLILVKSPVLKKVRIVLNGQVTYEDEVKMLRILLCSPRASPILEIYVEHCP